MIRMISGILVVLVVLTGIMWYRILAARHDPEIWHVDPLVAERPLTPNFYTVAPQELTEMLVSREAPSYLLPPQALGAALHQFIMQQSLVEIVAGDLDQGWITYVQRTPTVRAPDYVSVRIIALEDGGSTLAMFSRSRFGHGDMGLNEARVTTWLGAVSSFERGQ